MNRLVANAGLLGLILSLYGLRAVLYHFRVRPHYIALFYGMVVCVAVPMVWLISPNWNDPELSTAGKWVAGPVAVLFVPWASFLVDYFRGRYDMSRWFIRIPLEVLVAVPLWGFVWTLICIFVLDWIRL